DFDEKRNQRRVTDALNNLLKDAPNSKLKCAAIVCIAVWMNGLADVGAMGNRAPKEPMGLTGE
ncbi:hypothetical protein SAMN05216404_12513, partial [Nitrosospira multiformis]